METPSKAPRKVPVAQAPREESPLLERMLKTRTVLFSSEVSPTSAQRLMERLLVLEAEDPAAPITLLLNSPGGEVHSGFGVYDLIRFIGSPVRVVCVGLTASIATVILAAVPRERRFALPNARLLIHQPLFTGEVFGPASDLEITAHEILKTKDRVNRLLAEATGQPLDRIERDTERDFWLSAQEALDYGLIGQVIDRREALPPL
ncbi:MAG TPA: ATP-dependent Clp protease proteolytic subunit [Myxococcota bacterium]|nr:ATP-dependent Clp protease proteolytic subunit [Myxococcota bacterium]HQK51466.1 ATP-dependent Clp protease proteolytic subunit [Myxococcota bacterium]